MNINFRGQVAPGEIPQMARDGVSILVCHRPDDEEPGQPSHAELASAAEQCGVLFKAIPVSGMPTRDAVEATAALIGAMAPHDHAVFFCRSGMRSAATWAMAERLRGGDPEELRQTALAAGYDLSRLPL